ncbi:MAG TPA: hypothetical protein H9889_05960 [Candidatus Ignatzschineria merdigallinarum]|uniref:Uncharacterized protein n=1 Tax=Candidatus Ignatzschineria merdigallinarum TaxID=2838621 RepID=A0A9D1Q6B8_9GAMM|nr:hypothetical protein [Candidatus Ignatzschineria merdigallinarum]
MIKTLESKIIAEYQVDTDTFMIELHHHKFFNKTKFLELLDCCEKLIELYRIQKSKNYVEIAHSIIFLMQWVLLENVYHLSHDDLSHIKNYDSLLEEVDMSGVYNSFLNYSIDRIRIISTDIIV